MISTFYSAVSPSLLPLLVIQAKWRLPDGKPASRDTFMSVLSDVQAIYVRALYGDGPSVTSLRYIKKFSYLKKLKGSF